MKTIKITEKELRETIIRSVKSILTEEQIKHIQQEWADRHEEFRKKLIVAENEKARVMSRYYGIESNPYKPILVEKVTLDRIIKKHGDNGYVIISANRSDMEEERNDSATKSLIMDITQSGYSYLPVYGGYRNTSNGVEDSYEPSFIVFNYDVDGEERDFKDLYEFALSMCDKYEQHSVLIKAPDLPPVWKDKDGNTVSKRSSNKVWKNDPSKEYFTSLKPRSQVNPDKVSRRFTLDIGECYLNPIPCCLNEERSRKGEIMVWR